MKCLWKIETEAGRRELLSAGCCAFLNLINETQDAFDNIMNMQVPDIIPFENTALELKFQEISDQIVNATGA